jgi:tetratricopeptide (TPR) repeat protein
VLVPTARSVEVRAPRWGTAVAVVALVVAAAGIGYQGVVLAADNAYVHSKTASSPSGRTAAALRAVELNPFESAYRTAVALAYLDELLSYNRARARAQTNGEDTTQYLEAVRTSLADAESALEDAITFTPENYENYGILAHLYNVGAEIFDPRLYDKAIAAAQQGLAMEPYGIDIRVSLARALISSGKVAEGVKELEYAMSIDPTGNKAALMLASVYRQQGKTAEALALLKSVEALAPGRPGVGDAIRELEAGVTDTP